VKSLMLQQKVIFLQFELNVKLLNIPGVDGLVRRVESWCTVQIRIQSSHFVSIFSLCISLIGEGIGDTILSPNGSSSDKSGTTSSNKNVNPINPGHGPPLPPGASTTANSDSNGNSLILNALCMPVYFQLRQSN